MFTFFVLGILIKEEHIEKGSLHVDTYFTYMAAAGGLLVSLGIVLIMLFNVGTIAFSSWWLAYWIKAGSGVSINYISLLSYFLYLMNYNILKLISKFFVIACLFLYSRSFFSFVYSMVVGLKGIKR